MNNSRPRSTIGNVIKYKVESGKERIGTGINGYFSSSLKPKNRYKTSGIDFDWVKLKSRDAQINKVYSDRIKMHEPTKIFSVDSQKKINRTGKKF